MKYLLTYPCQAFGSSSSIYEWFDKKEVAFSFKLALVKAANVKESNIKIFKCEEIA